MYTLAKFTKLGWLFFSAGLECVCVFAKLVWVLLLFVLDKQLERVQELAHKKIGRERKQHCHLRINYGLGEKDRKWSFLLSRQFICVLVADKGWVN